MTLRLTNTPLLVRALCRRQENLLLHIETLVVFTLCPPMDFSFFFFFFLYCPEEALRGAMTREEVTRKTIQANRGQVVVVDVGVGRQKADFEAVYE